MGVSKRLIGAGAAGGAFVNNENFRAILYTGDDSTGRNITGVGFKPDFIWIKPRNQTENHNIYDTTRGARKQFIPNSTAASSTQGNTVQSFDADGFTLNGDNNVNKSGINYVAWCWKAGGGTTSSNSDGSITSTVQANTNSGFSIVKWTGTQSSATVGHGLGIAPKMVITKSINTSQGWPTLVRSSSTTFGGLRLNEDGANNSGNGNTFFQNTAPTTSVFTLGASDESNPSGSEVIAYCFADVSGFQKIDTYSGTGAAGNFIETGFEPAFLMIKRTNSTGGWLMFDNKRNTTNPRNSRLEANNTGAEQTGSTSKFVNFLSNGFEPQVSDSEINASSSTYLYWAVAANPDETTPTLASSFNIETYTGTGGNRSITGLGFGPGFIWLKNRDQGGYAPRIFDIVRGATERLQSSTTATESTDSTSLTSFDADGFSLGSDNYVNNSGDDFVAWAFKADDNEPTINTNGTITSITSVNANAGFSIVKYVGTGSNATVGHGLSATPELILIKNLDDTTNWNAWTPASGVTNFISLNLDTEMRTTSGTSGFSSGVPTSTLVNLDGSSWSNQSGSEHIMYCFHSISGYSKVGTYTGSTSGVTITTGFKPDFIFVKSTSNVENWAILDTRRGNFKVIKPNTNDAESDSTLNTFTVTSTGFSFPHQDTADAMLNENGYQYIYMAVAKNVPSNTTLANSFKIVEYSGSSSSQDITIGFKPDLVWAKALDVSHHWGAADSITGTGKTLMLNEANAQASGSVGIEEFGDTTIKIFGSASQFNSSGSDYVAFAWKAGNTWQSNVDGSIPSTVNANTANGFSIVKYTGTGANTTVGHSLGAAPEVMIIKDLDNTRDWGVYHIGNTGSSGYANQERLKLNTNDATTTYAPYWNGTTPTSTVFSLGNEGNVNTSGQEYIAYCWTPKSGFSKFGSYSGGSTGSGNVITTGFQPDWIMIKRTDTADDWTIIDSVRGDGSNSKRLIANSSDAEKTATSIWFPTSTGFYFSGTGDSYNASGGTYVYMTFKMN